MGRVPVAMDPHKRSAIIEVMDADETVLGGGRFGTDAAGYAAMKAYAELWPERVWAIEGCNGIGGHIARRLLADGEQVVDVPPKLSARARVFATGQGRRSQARSVCRPSHGAATAPWSPTRSRTRPRAREDNRKARRRVAAELISDLERIHKRRKGSLPDTEEPCP